ncbi:hypothetical protein RsTz2092_02130 [Deferribacterales bacterium RsTz2092]
MLCYHKTMDKHIAEQVNLVRDIIVGVLPVEKIFLFGSHAYGTPANDSDVDLYVVMKDDAPYRDLDAMDKITEAVWGKKLISTDILVAKKSRFNYRSTGPTLEREISQRGIVIYDCA